MVSNSLRQPAIELRHLPAFLAVVEEMSFSRAAERLGIAQPPLSRQIQRLESRLGVKLFDRSHASIQLTSAGEVFADGARRILHQIDQSVRVTRLVNQGIAGQLTIGIDSSCPACDYAVQSIHSYQEKCGDVQVQLKEMRVEHQLAALQTGEIDVGFITPRPLPDGLSMEILVREPLVAVLPSTHPLADRDSVSLSELEDEPLIMDARRLEGVNGVGERLLQDAQFRPKVIQSASDSRLILSFVASKLGVSILPASISKIAPRPEVAYRPIVPAVTMASLAVVWPCQNERSVITPFLEHLQHGQAGGLENDL